MKRLLILISLIIVSQTIFGQTNKKMQTNQIIKNLENLDYFKFLEGKDKVDFIIYLEENLESGWLDMPNQVSLDLKRGNKIQRGKPESIDKRSNIVNGEYLFRGGFETTLNEFETIFASRNLKFEPDNNSEEYSGQNNNDLNHKISVNGRLYQIFDGEMKRGSSEMEYLKSLLNLLNHELQIQDYSVEKFVVLTSMENLYFLLIDKATEEYIFSLQGEVQNKLIDLNQY